VTGAGAASKAPLIHSRYLFGFLLRLWINFAAGAGILYAILWFTLSRPLPPDYAGVFHALHDLASLLRPIVVLSVLAYALLACGSTAALCVFGLHKLAGPLYRMEKVIEEYAVGGPTRPLFFRHDDQIGPLAKAFNAWIASLRQDRQRWIARLDEAERLCLLDEATCRSEMEKALRQIAEDIARYR
jgi:hypothetical protein